MVASGKKTKKTHESMNNKLALVMKSGKFTLGYKIVLKTLRNSKGVDSIQVLSILEKKDLIQRWPSLGAFNFYSDASKVL